MLEYSKRAIKALPYLLKHYNDIDVYVEDKKTRNMYLVLIRRVLGDKAIISNIYQLGGRKEVIATCENDQGDTSRPRLYIIDGDFDPLLQRTESPKLNYFYQLRVYCSENLLICENSLSEILLECLPNSTQSQIRSLFNFNDFISHLVDKLVPLFIVYGAAHKLGANITTTNYSVFKFKDNRSKWKLSTGKINDRIFVVREYLYENYPQDIVDQTITEIQNNIPNQPFEALKFISGKSYILPIILSLFRANFDLQGREGQIKVRLANYTDLDIDPGFSEAILNSSKN